VKDFGWLRLEIRHPPRTHRGQNASEPKNF
jgi:hypothetical protein